MEKLYGKYKVEFKKHAKWKTKVQHTHKFQKYGIEKMGVQN